MLNTKIALTIALAACAGMAQAAKIPANITLSPYCDTLYGLSKSGGLATGMWDSDCDGSGETSMAGPTGIKLLSKGKGYAMAADTYPLYGVTEEVVVNADGTWFIYYANGGMLASGTWTPALAGVKATGKSIHAK